MRDLKQKMKTRILINGRFLTQPITGVQRYAREIVQALDDILNDYPNIEVKLISPKIETNTIKLRNIKHIIKGRLQGHRWEQFELPFFVKDEILFCPGNTAPVISLFNKSTVIVTVHDLSYLYFPDAYSLSFRFLYRLLIPLVLSNAKKIITVSKSERESIIKYYPFTEKKIYAILNGGNPISNISQSFTKKSENSQYVLYVGSLSSRKNFSGAFKVACKLAYKRGLKFVFIGSVPNGIISSSHSIPMSIKNRIKLVGQVDDSSTLAKYYQSASCLIFPSFHESSGLPPIEAMAYGCPVLVSRIPALQERCGDAALYCDPYDLEDMSEKIELILDDTILRDSLIKNGYKKAQSLNWHNSAKETLKVLILEF